MKKKLMSIILILSMCLCMSDAWASSSKTINLTSTVKTKKVKNRKIRKSEVKKLTSSSIKLLDETIKNDEEGANVLISPTSIMYAFGLLENGAKGITKRQIENNIFGGVKTSDTNKILNKQMNAMEKDNNVKWSIANSIWLTDKKDVKVKKKYLRKTASYYDADIFKTPFDNNSVSDINKWVKKNTNKMIPRMLDNVDKDTVMCLANAICFEGSWAKRFSDSQIEKNKEFTNYDNTKSKVTQMSGEGDGYFVLNGAYGFEKYYEGGRYAFVGIKMPEGVSTADYISKLTDNPTGFTKAIKRVKTDKDVIITMPEFKLDYDASLNDPIMNMGVTRAFDAKKANLYNMFKKNPEKNYYVSDVIHKTHMEVDKKGTKAAAATVIIAKESSAILEEKDEIHIKLDNPFVYAIVDTYKGLPVFMGCVNKLD